MDSRNSILQIELQKLYITEFKTRYAAFILDTILKYQKVEPEQSLMLIEESFSNLDSALEGCEGFKTIFLENCLELHVSACNREWEKLKSHFVSFK